MFWIGSGLFACAEEPPPPSVDDFMANSILLEATMVRCAQNRSSTKYDVECVNAREAINRMAKVDEAERRAAMEAQSERKRRALRRTQEAAAEARRRANEAERRRREAAYLLQFQSPPGGGADDVMQPMAPEPATLEGEIPPTQGGESGVPPVPPPVEEAVPDQPSGTDLESIREELKRRQGGTGQ